MRYKPPKGVIPPQLMKSLFTSGPSGYHYVWARKGENWDDFEEEIIEEIRIDLAQLKDAELRLEGFINWDTDTRLALEDVGEYVTKTVIPRMFKEGNVGMFPSDNIWPALKPGTHIWRRWAARHGGGNPLGPILRFSGSLYDQVTAGDSYDVRTGVGSASVRFAEYVNYKNAGKRDVHMSGHGAIPARPFLPRKVGDLTLGERDHIEDIFNKHIGRWAGLA